jgi:putative transposase
MPREPRVVAIGAPHHITQRGNARQDVFTTDSIRRAYLRLLGLHAAANRLRILAYCLMTNHVHIVAIPDTDAAMANTLRHAHGRFSQYWNTERNRIGHVWQNRYYSCPVEEAAVGRVIAYVENNPVRAGLVERAEDFEWSSAQAHAAAADFGEMLDGEWWQLRWSAAEWRTILRDRMESAQELRTIRQATYSGRPFGSKQFVAGLEQRLGRTLEPRARPRPKQQLEGEGNQMALWIVK